jgi:hypothetical protein
MVNAHLALCATDREIEDRHGFIEEAKRGLEVCKSLQSSTAPNDKIILLEETIDDAVTEVEAAKIREEGEEGEEGEGEEGKGDIEHLGQEVSNAVSRSLPNQEP